MKDGLTGQTWWGWLELDTFITKWVSTSLVTLWLEALCSKLSFVTIYNEAITSKVITTIPINLGLHHSDPIPPITQKEHKNFTTYSNLNKTSFLYTQLALHHLQHTISTRPIKESTLIKELACMTLHAIRTIGEAALCMWHECMTKKCAWNSRCEVWTRSSIYLCPLLSCPL